MVVIRSDIARFERRMLTQMKDPGLRLTIRLGGIVPATAGRVVALLNLLPWRACDMPPGTQPVIPAKAGIHCSRFGMPPGTNQSRTNQSRKIRNSGPGFSHTLLAAPQRCFRSSSPYCHLWGASVNPPKPSPSQNVRYSSVKAPLHRNCSSSSDKGTSTRSVASRL